MLQTLYTQLMRALNRLGLALCIILYFSRPSLAGPRADHWSGFDIGTMVPFPSLIGAIIGFNLQDDARLSFGGGHFDRYANYQIFDAKLFFTPTALSGYIGGGLDFLVGKRGKVWIWDLNFDRAFVPYLQIGIDYQDPSGFHATLNVAGTAPNGEPIVMPGLAVGWYF
ncbi:MAG: hypothetical protein AB1540_02410 [Bdellovibrionota bacterium]